VIDFLRSKIATLCVLVLALVAQLPHAAEVFMQAGGVHGRLATLHGAAYAMALELAVLLFVVQGHRRASYAFAGVSVLVNLAYYAERVQLFSVQGLSAWLISVALPVAIALYSHAVADAQGGFDAGAWLKSWRKGVQGFTPPSEIIHTPYHTPIAAQPAPLHDATPMQDDASDDDQPDPKEVAKQLKSEGLTYAQIAAQLNVDPSTVGRWFKNGANKVAA
jgi:DNA-directed RNA polymerase specialized sigma24 family protein